MLERELMYLKGVGPVRAKSLQDELQLKTWDDLLSYFPFRYIDRSKITTIRDIRDDNTAVQLLGEIISMKEVGTLRAKRLTAIFRDSTGDIELIWFKGIKWLTTGLKRGTPYILFGKPTEFKGRFNFTHPELELAEEARITHGNGLKPVYNTTQKLTQKGISSNVIAKMTRSLAEETIGKIDESLPDYIIERFKLISRGNALYEIHAPTDQDQLEQAKRRLKFEELFLLQLQLVIQKRLNSVDTPGVVFQKVGVFFNEFYDKHLPFPLTGAQKRVLKEVRADVARGHHMNRLVQGDVGSGKTIVAMMSALLAIDNGYQCCLMAPTEILAIQHMQTFSQLLAPLGIVPALLTGSTSKAARRNILTDLKSGVLKVIIGTHALIEPSVEFAHLGLCIIDEQHRFGVAQRASLWKKAPLPPHVLIMTATPIPRTLAMTLYGDLDISIIDELPPGRKPIKTLWKTDQQRLGVFQFMEDEIAKGRQIYVVYPLIDESEALDYKDLQDGYESISRRFPVPKYHVSIVHGQMKAEARDLEMKRFSEGRTHIMVATTVIEVGVNVPNASVMIIESAERFGLSQLHQLRGRVGRGADQSYCILMSGDKLSADSKKRLETMVRTNDGFEISEVDLQLRGPGDLAGTQQSGTLDLKIADLAKDQHILTAARELALEIIDEDSALQMHKNQLLRKALQRIAEAKTDWSKIS